MKAVTCQVNPELQIFRKYEAYSPDIRKSPTVLYSAVIVHLAVVQEVGQ